MKTKTLIVALAAVLMLGGGLGEAQAHDTTGTKITLKPVIGASFGAMHQAGSIGGRVSYWAGASVLTVNDHMSLWTALQRTVFKDADRAGVGPKFLMVIESDQHKRWGLLIGGGWLNNFNPGFNGDEDKDAMTIDLGLLYEFLTEQVFVGLLGSGVNTRTPIIVDAENVTYRSRLDWSVDFGLVGRFF